MKTAAAKARNASSSEPAVCTVGTATVPSSVRTSRCGSLSVATRMPQIDAAYDFQLGHVGDGRDRDARHAFDREEEVARLDDDAGEAGGPFFGRLVDAHAGGRREVRRRAAHEAHVQRQWRGARLHLRAEITELAREVEQGGVSVGGGLVGGERRLGGALVIEIERHTLHLPARPNLNAYLRLALRVAPPWWNSQAGDRARRIALELELRGDDLVEEPVLRRRVNRQELLSGELHLDAVAPRAGPRTRARRSRRTCRRMRRASPRRAGPPAETTPPRHAARRSAASPAPSSRGARTRWSCRPG